MRIDIRIARVRPGRIASALVFSYKIVSCLSYGVSRFFFAFKALGVLDLVRGKVSPIETISYFSPFVKSAVNAILE